MTPLFPVDDEPLIIKQGPVDDCYLLVSWDCIFNSGAEAQKLLKSKFTQAVDGVTVRIKHNIQSSNLKPEMMRDKYTYSYDRNTDEDVFFISNAKLKEMDESAEGVETNSLAVKILERISPYYYMGAWDPIDLSASLKAHSISLRHAQSSTLFVGSLLGISAIDRDDIDEIIKLKLMNPLEAVYISIAYGEPDTHGKIHGRHALRIDNVVLNPDGEYVFSLVNPWDNQKYELFTLTELKKRDYRFCTFSPNPHETELKNRLLTLPLELGKYVFVNPDIHHLLIQFQKINLLSNADNIQFCIALHKQMPFITELYSELAPDDQVKLIQSIIDARGNKERFLKTLLTKIPNLELVTSILQKDQFNDTTVLTLKVMALESHRDIRSTTRALFADQTFFNLMMHSAMHHKARARACTFEDAQRVLEPKLIDYFFDTLTTENLPKLAGIRELFQAKLFAKKAIENWFTPNYLLAYSVGILLNENRLTKPMIEYITKASPALINEEFVNAILANYSSRNPREFFAGLYQLQQINPLLVKAIFPLAIQKINSHFGMPIEHFEDDIVLEAPNEFKNWFIAMHNPKLKYADPKFIAIKKANRIVNECLEQINGFVIPAETSLNKKTVELNRTNLNKKLTDLVTNNVDLSKSLVTLGITVEEHIEIQNALNTKKQIIISEAEKAEKRIMIRNRAFKYLHEIKFLHLIEQVHILVETYSNKAELNPAYTASANAGRAFYEELIKTQNTFLSSKLNYADLKKNSLLAVRHASTILSKYPDWKLTIGKISQLFEPKDLSTPQLKVANQKGTFFMKTGSDLLTRKPNFRTLQPLTFATVVAA